MKSFNKYISLPVAALATAVSMSSCSDFLDKEPDMRVELKTTDQVAQLLTTAYPIGNYGWMCELSSDNLADNQAPHASADANSKGDVYYNLAAYDRGDDEAFRFEQVKSNTNTDSPSMVWQTYYASIATANQALEAIDKIVKADPSKETAQLKAARAEALLVRAYSHFILVNIFSQAYKNDEASKADVGIPYSTKPETTVKPHYDRGTVTDTYKKIQADLEAGLKDISDVNYDKPKWHFNINAAHAFAARFYLYTRQYDKVIEQANAVLGTDDATTLSMLRDYTKFVGLSTSTDYANAWQTPDDKSNLMLLSTKSKMWRRSLGNRYSLMGDKLKQTIWREGPTWRWTAIPVAMVTGMTFYSSNQDWGYTSAKIAERFEYSDKVAGIGYPHVIRCEFTTNELLLERAEAKLLKANHDIDGCVNDLAMYVKNMQTFDTENQTHFSANQGMVDLTKDILVNYYSMATNPNCFENWDFTQKMSNDFVIPHELTPYMNCINDMRRIETLWDGTRFFDLKRFGIEYSHIVGKDKVEYKLTWNDPRRAVEVAPSVEAAGLQTSRPLVNATSQNSSIAKRTEK